MAQSPRQPAPLDATHRFQSEALKTVLAEVIKAAFADGENAEKARVTEILHAPGAEELPQSAMVSRSRRCDRRSSDLLILGEKQKTMRLSELP